MTIFKFINLKDIYYCIYPFVTLVQYFIYKHKSKEALSIMVDMTELNDDVYRVLNKLGFTISDIDLRCIVARGKVTPDVNDKATVELDANIWIQDALSPIQQFFDLFGLGGQIEVIPEYLESQDSVVFYMRSIYVGYLEDMQRFLFVNLLITTLEFLLLLQLIF